MISWHLARRWGLFWRAEKDPVFWRQVLEPLRWPGGVARWARGRHTQPVAAGH